MVETLLVNELIMVNIIITVSTKTILVGGALTAVLEML